MFWTIAILVVLLLLATAKSAYTGIREAKHYANNFERIKRESEKYGAALNQGTRRYKK